MADAHRVFGPHRATEGAVEQLLFFRPRLSANELIKMKETKMSNFSSRISKG